MNKLFQLMSRAVPGVKESMLAKINAGVKDGIRNDPHLAAKFYPYEAESRSYLLKPFEKVEQGARLPVPPSELWCGYGGAPVEKFLATGQGFVDSMKGVVKAAGGLLEPGNRILDFGCGSGLMLRFLHDLAQTGEVWGVDISETHIYWLQRHLSPPYFFATCTSFPHLPFEDGYFDFVYAGSVFTHIADLSETWLLELKRITRPGGKLYLTIHDEHTADLLLGDGSTDVWFKEMLRQGDINNQFQTEGFAMFSVNRTPGIGNTGEAQVFHHTDYIRKHWGRYLQVLSITREAYGKQSAVLLQK